MYLYSINVPAYFLVGMAVGIGRIDIDLLGVSLHLKNTFNGP